MIIPCTLGWSNGNEDPNDSFRLYALDKSPHPRWDNKPYGRTIEAAIRLNGGDHEGARYLLVRVDDRHVTNDKVMALIRQIEELQREPDQRPSA